MDKTMNIINAEKEDYIDWLMIDRGMSREEAERMAEVMGY